MADIAVVVRDSGSGLSLEIIDENDFDVALQIRYPMFVRDKGTGRVCLIDELDFLAGHYEPVPDQSASEQQASADCARARQAEE